MQSSPFQSQTFVCGVRCNLHVKLVNSLSNFFFFHIAKLVHFPFPYNRMLLFISHMTFYLTYIRYSKRVDFADKIWWFYLTQHQLVVFPLHVMIAFLRPSEFMQEKASSASFALLGRKYLQPSLHVLATVLARTCNRPRTYLREKTIITCFSCWHQEFPFPSWWAKKRLCRHWDTVWYVCMRMYSSD